MQFQKKRCVAMLLAGGQGSRLMVLTENTGQARRAVRRQIPHHRFPAFQLRQLQDRHRRHSDPVPAAGAQRVHRQRPAVGPQLHPTAACRCCRPMPRARTPSGTRARPTPSIRTSRFIERYDPDNVLILSGDHIYKMDYAAMLALPRAARFRLHHRRARGADRGGQPLRHHEHATRTAQSTNLRRSRRSPRVDQRLHGHLRLQVERAARPSSRRTRPTIPAKTTSARTSSPPC